MLSKCKDVFFMASKGAKGNLGLITFKALNWLVWSAAQIYWLNAYP